MNQPANRVTTRLCLACGAHVPMPHAALRCMDCGGPDLTPAQLRRFVAEFAPSHRWLRAHSPEPA